MTIVRDATLQKHYANANKIFELPGLPLVAMTYGLGGLGRRSIGSLIDEWTSLRPNYEKAGYTVEQIAQELGSWIFTRHRQYRNLIRQDIERRQSEALAGTIASSEIILEFNPRDWTTGIVIGGYQPGSFFPWLWEWEEPTATGEDGSPTLTRLHEGNQGRDGPESGVDYWGDVRALERLFKGYDPAVLSDLIKRDILRPSPLRSSAEFESGIEELTEHHAWRIVSEGMPIQDAADLTRFLLQVGCGFERFKEGNAQIGGDLDIAVLTRSAVHWDVRKPMTEALAARRREYSAVSKPRKRPS